MQSSFSAPSHPCPLTRGIYFCHHPFQIGPEEWLADQGVSVAVALASGQKDDVEAVAKAPRALRQFSSAQPWHIDVGYQHFDALIVRDCSKSVIPRARLQHFTTKLLQHRSGQLKNQGIIIHE